MAGVAAAGCLLLALVVRAGSLTGQGFDGLYGQDAFAYYGYAAGPLRQALLQFPAAAGRSSGRRVIRCWWRSARLCWA